MFVLMYSLRSWGFTIIIFYIHIDAQLLLTNTVKRSQISSFHFTLFYFANCSQPLGNLSETVKHEQMHFMNIVQNLPNANNHAPGWSEYLGKTWSDYKLSCNLKDTKVRTKK